MILAAHQPIFLPWPGFFFKALQADVFVLLDAVQFPLGRSWMTRNRLKSPEGEFWLRVPVYKRGRGRQSIDAVEICETRAWRRTHLRSLYHHYARAPYLEDHLPAIERTYDGGQGRLVELNVALIRMLAAALGVEARLLRQSELGIEGRGPALLVSLCRALGADAYLTLPSAEKHLDRSVFAKAEIALIAARFYPPIYPQLWGEFRYNLSALDLLLNCGPRSRALIERAGRG